MDDFKRDAEAILAQHIANMDAAAARHNGIEKDLSRFRYAADNYNMITGELMRLNQETQDNQDEKSRIVSHVLWAFVNHARG